MKKSSTLTLLTGLLLFASGIASADSKTVSGSVCSPWNNGNYLVIDGGAITTGISQADTNVLIQCPIVREQTGNSPIKTLEVRMKRTGFTNLRASCTVQSTDQWGVTFSSQFKQTGTRGSSANRLIRYNNIPTKWRGVVSLRCVLPRGFQLSTIYWDE